MSLSLFFALAFAAGLTFFSLFVLENIQGRMSRRTTWKEMTAEQWVFFLGSFLSPIGLIGFIFTKG